MSGAEINISSGFKKAFNRLITKAAATAEKMELTSTNLKSNDAMKMARAMTSVLVQNPFFNGEGEPDERFILIPFILSVFLFEAAKLLNYFIAPKQNKHSLHSALAFRSVFLAFRQFTIYSDAALSAKLPIPKQ